MMKRFPKDCTEECEHFSCYDLSINDLCCHCNLLNINIDLFDEDNILCPYCPLDKTENKLHELKTQPEYYEKIVDETKTFEVRKNDRDFKVGDFLLLREYDSHIAYTGRSIKVKITYILDSHKYVKKGYVIMGISLLEQTTRRE